LICSVSRHLTADDLRDTPSDYQVIGAVRALEFCTKNEEKALMAVLTQRNECAHPSDYEPGLNETLGYVSQVIKRIETLQKRWSKSQVDSQSSARKAL
jgi:hypothetical protein